MHMINQHFAIYGSKSIYHPSKMQGHMEGNLLKLNIGLMILVAMCFIASCDNKDLPPTINELASDKTSPQEVGSMITWTAEATDPDEDPLLFKFLLNDQAITNWTTDNTWIWNTSEDYIGNNRIEVQVIDGKHAGTNGSDDIRSKAFDLIANAVTSDLRNRGNVTLILYIRNEDQSEFIIPGARITGQDGNGDVLSAITDGNGRASLQGYPGNWSLRASANGFRASAWFQQIADICTKDVFLKEDKASNVSSSINSKIEDVIESKISLTLFIHNGSLNGPLVSGAQVISQDANGNSIQRISNNNGYANIKGDPGTWYFTAFAEGFILNSWSEEILETCTKHKFLEKDHRQEDEKSKPKQLSGTEPSIYNSIWKTKYQNDVEWAAKGLGGKGRPKYNS